jgi:hypothetical protein
MLAVVTIGADLIALSLAVGAIRACFGFLSRPAPPYSITSSCCA